MYEYKTGDEFYEQMMKALISLRNSYSKLSFVYGLLYRCYIDRNAILAILY